MYTVIRVLDYIMTSISFPSPCSYTVLHHCVDNIHCDCGLYDSSEIIILRNLLCFVSSKIQKRLKHKPLKSMHQKQRYCHFYSRYSSFHPNLVPPLPIIQHGCDNSVIDSGMLYDCIS